MPNLSHSSHPCIIHTQYKDRKLRTEEQEEEEARVVSHKKKWHFRHSLWVGFQQPYPTRSLLLSLSSIQSMHLGYMLLSIMAFMNSILHDFFQLDLPHSIDVPRFAAFTSCNSISACSRETAFDEESKIPIWSFYLHLLSCLVLAAMFCGEFCFWMIPRLSSLQFWL